MAVATGNALSLELSPRPRLRRRGGYTDIVEGNRAIPRWLAIRLIKARQLGGFVKGDGSAAKLAYGANLFHRAGPLAEYLRATPFVLGTTPSIADYGLMGPMLRHFSQDPVPAEIMRARAPCLNGWRACGTPKPPMLRHNLSIRLDDALAALLGEACDTNLVQHAFNAQAYTAGAGRYDMCVQDTDYKRIPTSRYRVWCLENLRRAWAALDAESQNALKAVLPPSAAILWQATDFAPSEYDSANEAPFNRGINVYGNGVPGIFSLLIAAIRREVLTFFLIYQLAPAYHIHSKRKNSSIMKNGGGGGIRTPGTRKRSTVFKTAAFNHSATLLQWAQTPVRPVISLADLA